MITALSFRGAGCCPRARNAAFIRDSDGNRIEVVTFLRDAA
jgi:hypothetical protein